MTTDTPRDLELELDRMFAQRSGSERMQMASDMFDCARRIAVSAIRATRPHIGETELRLALFERFYADDYSDDERASLRLQLAVSNRIGLRP